MKSSKLSRYSLVSIAMLIGCHQPAVIATPASIPSPDNSPSDAVIRRTTASWTFTTDTATHAYQLTTRALFQSDPQVTSAQSSIIVQSRFHIHRTLHIATGSIDSLLITDGSKRVREEDSIHFVPKNFSLEISGNKIQVALTSSSTCSPGIVTVLGGIRNQAVVLPMFVTTMSVWSDTVSIESCKTDDIQSTGEIVRSYKILGETRVDGIPALVIQRTEASQVSGIGHQEQHQIKLDADGSGSTTIQVEASTGIVLTTNSTQKLNIRIQASGKVQRFTQLIDERANRLY